MAYDIELAERIARLLKRRRRVTQRQMFGGVCFLVNGNMCCGVHRNKLMVRVGPERYESALRKPHARLMDITGKPLRGFLFVMPGGLKTDKALRGWLDYGVQHAASLPAKKAKH